MGVSERHGRGRLAGLLSALLLVVMVGLVSTWPERARAQDNPPAQPEEKAEKQEFHKPNPFIHIIESAGIFFGPLLFLVSIGMVTLIVLLAMDLRMSNAIPANFVDDFTDVVNKRQFKQAFELCRADSSYLGRVLTAGMGRLQYGIEDARDASHNMVESVKASKEQLINYLGTIGTLGPMLGLVGTVWGMILAFMDLAVPGQTPNPADLAKNISHALVVTLLGIALSVPAIFSFTFFKNRLTRITMDTANLADDLLTQMYHNSKKQPAAATPAPTAAPANARPAGSNTASIKPAAE